jgi:dephospho-CoA kinase
MMLKVGLTGGIGCGKTTVSRLFADLNVPIIDADDISHQLVQPNQIALQKIQATLGREFILENGQLNRIALKKHIFENIIAKQQLEAILHPLIFQEISNQIIKYDSEAYCVISIPLLFETNSQSLVDRILVIDCDTQTQIERVRKRDNLSFEQVQAIIANQINSEFRKNNAHDLLNNSQNQDILAKEVKKLHNFYLSLSQNYNTHTCDFTNYLRIST